MKMNWGIRIAALYIAFVVMIVTLVAATFARKPSLVADDYYYRETTFQQQLEARKAAAALGAAPRAHLAGDRLELWLPGSGSELPVRGLLRYYFPGAPAADHSEAFSAASGPIRIGLPVNTAAHCLIQIDWVVAGTHYYSEIPAPWML